MTEDEMIEGHCRLNGHEFEQAPGDGKGQGSLACASVHWIANGHDTSVRLNKITAKRMF